MTQTVPNPAPCPTWCTLDNDTPLHDIPGIRVHEGTVGTAVLTDDTGDAVELWATVQQDDGGHAPVFVLSEMSADAATVLRTADATGLVSLAELLLLAATTLAGGAE